MYAYTNEDGSVSVIRPAPKAFIERDVGMELTDVEYRNLVLRMSVLPLGISSLTQVLDQNLPDRELRSEYKIDEVTHRVGVDMVKARAKIITKIMADNPGAKLSDVQKDAIDADTPAKLLSMRGKYAPSKAPKG